MLCLFRLHWLRATIRLALLLPALFLACALVRGAPRVSAASGGTIAILGPTSGPVDAVVTLEIRQYPSVVTSYKLAATTTSPDQGGCGSAQSLSGVAPFQVSPNRGADVTFHWPASLGKGSYWFCATSVDGSAPAAMSQPSAPYTVLTSIAPTVRVVAPSSIAQPGATITVKLANWLTSDGSAPSRVVLLRQGASLDSAITIAAEPREPGDSVGDYTLTATLPSFIATGGQYAAVAQGECGSDPLGTGKIVCAVTEQSPFFAIAQSPTPTPIATSVATKPAHLSSGSGENGGSNAGMPWIALVVGLILLVSIVGLVVVLVRRAGAHRRQTQSAHYSRDPDYPDDSRYNQWYDSHSRR